MNAEFLNACRYRQCEPFDDSSRLHKVYADGGFPAVGLIHRTPESEVLDETGHCSSLSTPCGSLPERWRKCRSVRQDTRPVVYFSGSTAAAFLAALARSLIRDTMPITIVYKSVGSLHRRFGDPQRRYDHRCCFDWDPQSTTMATKYPARSARYDPRALSITGAIGRIPLRPATALRTGCRTDVQDTFGPVQTMTFVVPKSSTQKGDQRFGGLLVFRLRSRFGK